MDLVLLHRKEHILLAAIDMLDQSGISGLSTKEVAKRLGISEATIFKHFHTKNDLLLAIQERFSQYDSDLMASAAAKGLKPIEALLFFWQSLLIYYENYPAITVILELREYWRTDPVLGAKAAEVYQARQAFIERMVEEARQTGEIATNVDSRGLTVLILGLLREWCSQWRTSGLAFPLADHAMEGLRTVLTAFSATNGRQMTGGV